VGVVKLFYDILKMLDMRAYDDGTLLCSGLQEVVTTSVDETTPDNDNIRMSIHSG
jgi:hypothetical protein